MKWLLLFSVVLVNQFINIDSCDCVGPPGGFICNSAFSARVKVIKEQNIGLNDRVYIISVERIYRTNESARKALEDGKLYSYGSSASCGVDDLYVNHTYIVTGEVLNGKTQIGGCDFHFDYNDADDQLKREFEGPHQCR